MNFHFTPDFFHGVWSAMPTPLRENGTVDTDCIPPLIEHQLRLGVKGLFIGGTSGEGPWLSDTERMNLVRATVKAVARRIPVTFQITDNSAQRMIENLHRYQDTGLDMVIIAPPFFLTGYTQDSILELFNEVMDASELPVGIYNRGKYSSVVIEPDTLIRILSHPKVLLIKDSACLPEYTEKIIALRDASQGRIHALNGNEFAVDKAIQDRYDGVLLGGACFNAFLAGKIISLAAEGKMDEAHLLQERMNDMMYDVFGGKSISCWLKGQKELMVRLGVFQTSRTLLGYRLTPECSAAIDQTIRHNREFLLP